ncbi:MAG: hypothetical protein H7X86_12195, partial [Gorillibacterium sp.]|nr:hypothetical protein [Gorillibacterium sp.]
MLKLLLVGLLLLEPTGIPDPLTLVVHDQAFIIPRSELALPVWMTPDIAAIQKWVDRAGKLVYTAPQNAIWLGPGKYTPGQNGKQLDQKLLMEQMLGYVLQTGPLTIQAETKVIYPKVDTELLTEITHKAIAHYATYFNVHNDSRAHNIRLAVA